MNSSGARRSRSSFVVRLSVVLGASLVLSVPVAHAQVPSEAAAPAPLTGSLGSVVSTTGSASSGAHEEPPYIAAAAWDDTSAGPVLRITPTAAGRISWGPDDEVVAWSEVLALAPDADSPGMRQQFACHWVFARTVEPDKATWNLEPWRPVVSDAQMIAAQCNPTSDAPMGSLGSLGS